MRSALWLAIGLATSSACGSAPGGSEIGGSASVSNARAASASAPSSARPSAGAVSSFGGPAAASPEGIVVGANGSARQPFVLWLHGLGSSGNKLAKTLEVERLARELDFAYAAPDGDENGHGQRFWNAGAACCDFEHQNPDHVARLSRIVAAAVSHPNIDPARIFVIGFSNGGFMAHRLACHDSRVTGIATLGAAGPRPDESCPARPPLALVAVNGDADKAVAFEGGSVLGRHDVPPHPSARDTVLAWGKRNGCSGALEPAGALDLETALPGEETSLSRVAGCARPVELWVVHGGSHFAGTHGRAASTLLRALGAVGAAK